MGDPAAAPPPPDYAAANAAAINTDIETLPMRRAIEKIFKYGGEATRQGYTSKEVEDRKDFSPQISKLESEIADITKRITHPAWAAYKGNNAYINSEIEKLANANPEIIALKERIKEVQAQDAAQVPTKRIQYYDPSGKAVDKSAAVVSSNGFDDLSNSLKQAGVDAQLADMYAKNFLKLQKEMGPEFVDQARAMMKRSDPESFQAHKDTYTQIMKQLAEGEGGPQEDALTKAISEAGKRSAYDEFSMGGEGTADQNRMWEQAYRAGGAARGNVSGNAPTFGEAMAKTGNQQALKQNRLNNLLAVGANAFGQEQGIRQEGLQNKQRNLSNLSHFSANAPLSSQFQSLGGAQVGAAPYTPASATQGIGLNPNAGQLGTNYAMQGYQAWLPANLQASIYNDPMNRVGQGMELGGKFVGGVAGMMKCSTARLVFGETNPQWVQFYFIKELVLPDWFRNLYNENTDRFAAWLSNKPKFQRVVRWAMKGVISAYGRLC